MSKILLLNKADVIIDIADTLKPVRRNENDLVILCPAAKAVGYIGSDGETVYPKWGMQIYPTYSDIASYITVEDDMVDGIEPRKYKYDTETATIVENKDEYPETDLTLTELTNQANANIEYLAMMSDIEL